jgi:hypothetical protein
MGFLLISHCFVLPLLCSTYVFVVSELPVDFTTLMIWFTIIAGSGGVASAAVGNSTAWYGVLLLAILGLICSLPFALVLHKLSQLLQRRHPTPISAIAIIITGLTCPTLTALSFNAVSALVLLHFFHK